MNKLNTNTQKYSLPQVVVFTLKGFSKCHKKYSSMARVRHKLNLPYCLKMDLKILNLNQFLKRI